MNQAKELDALFEKHGLEGYRWLDPGEIVVAQWVRTKCMFGCGEYGRNATCPPNVPSVPECRQFFSEYNRAVIFPFEKRVEKPEDRHAWTRGVNQGLLELEREVFIAGHERAFILFADSCYLCSDCPGVREECRHPRSARPSPESMAVDVFSTVRKAGYSIEVLSDYSQAMRRFSFLLID